MAHKGLSTHTTMALLCPRAGPWLSQPASGHPGTNWTMLAHSTWCTHFSPNTGGNCLWTQRTATGKARLANGRAEFPAKLATLSGGTKVNRGPPCWSGKVLPQMSCACGLILQTMTLVLGCTWALGSMKGHLPPLLGCRKMLTEWADLWLPCGEAAPCSEQS